MKRDMLRQTKQFFTVIVCVAMLPLAAFAAPQNAKKAHLVEDGLSAWRGDTGEWENVGGVHPSAEDPKLLATEPGSGVIVNGPTGRTVNILSEEEFGDVRAHVEWLVPEGSNSGVYFMGRYEVQILDSWGVEEPTYTDAGGIYQRWDENRDPKGYEGHGPRVNASRAPGEWQTFDVIFRAPRFDEAGNKTKNARFVRVEHNGQIVHENVEVTGPTRAAAFNDEAPFGPLMLQGDHGPVGYRNLWVIPYLEGEDGQQAQAAMQNPFFAMDTGTRDEAHQTPEAQAKMLEELGYAGTDNLGVAELEETLKACEAHDLRFFALYTGINIDEDTPDFEDGLLEALPLLEGRDAVLWTPVNSEQQEISDPAGDAQAVRAIEKLADAAAEHDLEVALYPHTLSWMETHADALRIVKQVDRDNVGLTFNLCHWLRNEGEDLEGTLQALAPHLRMVTINGAEEGGSDWTTLIQPLGQGSYNVRQVLAVLRELGYAGPIGLQGFGIGGDVAQNLAQSMAAWQQLSTGFRKQ